MEALTVIEIIKGITECIKEGMDMLSVFNEHYQHFSRKIRRKENSYTLSCNVVEVKTGQVFSGQREEGGNVLLCISNSIGCSDELQYRRTGNHNMITEIFNDRENLEQISTIMKQHQKDSIIVIRSCRNKKILTLQVDMLNIVPGNDGLCYRINCSAKCNVFGENDKKNVKRYLDEIVDKIMNMHQKYQQTVDKSLDRLELEARILENAGCKNISFRQIDMGFGLDIELGNQKLIFGIPYKYPQKEPTVVVLNGDSYKQIEFGTEWDSFFTIEHIVKALSGGKIK